MAQHTPSVGPEHWLFHLAAVFIPLGPGRETSRLLPSESLHFICEGKVIAHKEKTVPELKMIRSVKWLFKILSVPLRIESPLCETPSSLGSPQ